MNDLISRSAVLDLAYCAIKPTHDNPSVRVVVDVDDIERLPAIDAVPRWISVEERLPEKLNGNYQLYLTKEVIGFGGECIHIGRFKIYKFDGRRTFFDGSIFRDDITHWMPLPEPPEE